MPAQTVDLDVRDTRLTGIVAPDALLEPLATGFDFLEGPVWLSGARALIFSDIPGDTLYRNPPDCALPAPRGKPAACGTFSSAVAPPAA